MCTPGDSPHNSRWMRTRGQAAVETAITMPLVVFMMLGTLQLFMLLQGRLMAEHAAFKAVRAGSVNSGSCVAMTHAAIAALLPSLSTFLGATTPGASPQEKLVNAFRARTVGKPNSNQFDPTLDQEAWGLGPGKTSSLNNAVVWIFRPSPAVASVTAASEEDFDTPDPVLHPGAANPEFGYELRVRLVFWAPMRIPFANWVMANMLRAYFGLGDFTGVSNPTLPVAKANWTRETTTSGLDPLLAPEFNARFAARQYSFPIVATHGMRMMTPPRPVHFGSQNCAPAPP